MDRRLFLGLSGAALPSLMRCAPASAEDGQSGAGSQTEDGVFVEDSPKTVMRGFPPENPIRAEDLHSTDDHRRRWALQHISELCKTQRISRGPGQVTVLPRKMQDLDDLEVRNENGHSSLSKFLRDTSTDAFLVMHRGRILTEQYFNGMRPCTPHLIWSCTKSISAGVVANLLEDNSDFTRDSDVTKYVPELKGCGYDGCTIEHLLNMQSSVAYQFGHDPVNILRHKSGNECGRHYRSAEMYPKIAGDNHPGQYAFLQSLRVDDRLEPPGSTFCYKDSDTAVLSWVCEEFTGKRFVDLISDLVWSQLGAEHDGSIICGPQGDCTPAAGGSITLRDFARWGQMHLQSGSWNGKRIVPARFIQNVAGFREPLVFGEGLAPPEGLLPDSTTYHDQFWITAENEGAYFALGHCGQICYIHPRSEVVIVRFASAKELEPKYRQVLEGLADVARALS